MKGPGRGIQRLQYSIVDLFPGSPSCSRQMKPSRWMDVNTHTHKHTCVLNGCPQTNVVKYFLSIGSAKYTTASPLARKFGTWINSNIQNSMTMFNFCGFDWNYPFWANLVQINKIVRISWNLVPRLIRIHGV